MHDTPAIMEDHIAKVKASMSTVNYDKVNIHHDRLTSLANSAELASAIQKRLVNSDARSKSVPIVSLVLCVLSEDGYNINHDTVNGTHIDTFMKIWEFIGTTSVSSTTALRIILSKCIKGRDNLGYVRSVTSSVIQQRNIGARNNLFGRNIEWQPITGESGTSYDNLRESILVDTTVTTMSSKLEHTSGDVKYIIDTLSTVF